MTKQETRKENRMIFINGNYQGTFEVDVCNICKGHLPVTKKVADGECVGHGGVLHRFLVGEQYPQFKESKKKVLQRKKGSKLPRQHEGAPEGWRQVTD